MTKAALVCRSTAVDPAHGHGNNYLLVFLQKVWCDLATVSVVCLFYC